MKILFVCHQNVGRSQIAKAIYNSLVPGDNASAAGTYVDIPGQTIAERKRTSTSKNFFLLDAMKEVGIDLSDAKRETLTKDALSNFDLIISMEKKERTPDWLLRSKKYVYWHIPDPRGQDLVHTRHTRDLIKEKVISLAEDITE